MPLPFTNAFHQGGRGVVSPADAEKAPPNGDLSWSDCPDDVSLCTVARQLRGHHRRKFES